jgi:tetratricopeptide (TPR) repeat protein
MMRVAAIVVACALAVAPARASAEEPAAPAQDPAFAKAEELHLDAEAKYRTADYEGALTSWQQAFKTLPRTPEANPYRALILYNIAASYEKLYDLRGDTEYLKQARINLTEFESQIDETYAGSPEEGEAERANVKAKIAHIDELLAAAPQKQPDPVPKPKPDPPQVEPKPTPIDDAPPPKDRSARGFTIGGAVLLGLGVAAGAGMGAAMAVGARANRLHGIADDNLEAREARFDRGRAANAGAIAAGVIGLACIATGIALIAVGAKRRSSRTAAIGRGIVGLVGGRPWF